MTQSMFAMGFRTPFQPHRLGQDWGNLIPSLIQTGANVYGQVAAADAAEDLKRAQQAAAAAAAANAAAAATAAKAAPTILGMSQGVAIMGGIGLIALVGLVAILK
jgi:hypothetical protein